MDFDDFLTDANEQSVRDAEMEAYKAILDKKLEAVLIKHEVPFIAFPDADIRQALLGQATEEYEIMLREHYDETNEPIDHLVLAEHARGLAEAQMVKEQAILARIQMAIFTYEFEFKRGGIPDKSFTDHTKKRLTADIMTEENLSADDPLVLFINDVVPGESLDTTSREDDDYMLQALEKHANSIERQKKDHELTTEVNATLEQAGELSKERILVATELTKTAMFYASKGSDAEAMRQARYDEIIRDNNLPADLARQLLTLIEQYYPLTPND